MTLFCGIDIVEVERVKRLYREFGKKFLDKIFPESLEYCFKKKKKEFWGCIAGRIALKEALIKAYSQAGFQAGWKDFEVIGGGKDLTVRVKFKTSLKPVFSISHERNYAVAVVILNGLE